jgi:hypothetical protein
VVTAPSTENCVNNFDHPLRPASAFVGAVENPLRRTRIGIWVMTMRTVHSTEARSIGAVTGADDHRIRRNEEIDRLR